MCKFSIGALFLCISFNFHFYTFQLGCFRSTHHRCSVRKGVLWISQNSQENTFASVSFFGCLRPATLLKKRLWYRCFPVNFAKFLRIGRLLLTCLLLPTTLSKLSCIYSKFYLRLGKHLSLFSFVYIKFVLNSILLKCK